MKKLFLLIIALALLLSACLGPFTPGGESTPPHSDASTSPLLENESTQPTYYYGDWSYIEEPIYTEDDVVFTENGIIAGPFTFVYIDDTFTFFLTGPSTTLNGLNLVSCDTDATEVVIPSAVCNIPVVAVGYHSPYGPALEEYVFTNSTSLKVLYIPDSVLYIDDAAFSGCNNLTDVRLSYSIEYLGAYGSDYGEVMFGDTEVKFLEVPEGVSLLGYYTFRDSDIEYLILPSTLTGLFQDSMTNCPLRNIYFRATEEHYPESLLEEIDEQTDATLYFYSETEPTEEGNFWHYVDGKPVIW